MRRGQILGQVFILILASAIFILILLYGYRAIGQFTQRSEQVAFIDFENTLRDAVKQVSLDFGSVKRVDISVPRKYRELCVFCSPDLRYVGQGCNPTDAFRQEHPLLADSWEGGAQNVFLVPLAETPILIDRLEARDGGFCTPIIEGKVALRLEGKGDRTFASPWVQSAS